MRPAALLLTMLPWGCSAPPAPPANNPSNSEQTASVRAQRARVASARHAQDTASVLDELQLRVQRISSDPSADGRSPSVALRLYVDNPWVVSARRDAERQRLQAERAQLREVSDAERARLCKLSVNAHAEQRSLELYERYARHGQAALNWITDWQKANTVNPIRGLRLALRLRRELVELSRRRLVRPSPDRTASYPLPVLRTAGASLNRSSSMLRRILAEHPRLQVQAAEAGRYRALSRAESNRQWPWLRFIEAEYDTNQPAQAEAFQAQIALGIPLSSFSGARQRAWSALERSLKEESEAIGERLMELSSELLEEIDRFEQTAGDLKQLQTDARQAAERSARLIEQRLGDAADATNLWREALNTELMILGLQEQAASANCDLIATTGRGAAQWPRKP